LKPPSSTAFLVFAPPQPRAGLFNEGDFYNLEMRLEVVTQLDRLRQIGYLGFEYSNRSSYQLPNLQLSHGY
jgi:hypothetical protein